MNKTLDFKETFIDYDDYFDDELSSSPSITDENIDFNFVYALRSFVATVEGQANVIKGDILVLLDDSNSYWWLVRLERDHTVGYLPAEHIETPLERLARLNKYRNAEISSFVTDEQKILPVFSKNKQICNKDNKLVVFSVPTYIEYLEESEDNNRCIEDVLGKYEECEIYNYDNHDDVYEDDKYIDFSPYDMYMRHNETYKIGIDFIEMKRHIIDILVFYNDFQNVVDVSDLEDVLKATENHKDNETLYELCKNCHKHMSKRMSSEVLNAGNNDKKDSLEFLCESCDSLDNIELGNIYQIYSGSRIYDMEYNNPLFCDTNIDNSLIASNTQINIFNDSEFYKIENSAGHNIYTEIEDDSGISPFGNIKYDSVLETCGIYNKDIYLSKGALRLYFDEKSDSELYFFVDSVFSFNKNDNNIYSEIHNLYVDIEFELEKISQQLDTMLIKFRG
ncbi:protein phosphatase regulator BUD14 [Pneumocystis jirovecii RU7]|uniref:SH3 domain-containing protein n=1 Tax=Pneumocystis jirovecii (strain RU7) TaxID=1408657 RepID=A0A0W4ZNJ7_PNEJ7|nr:protein phosphatase regulator BUD14 [Pneumocystis jirovecii RU7]KTW29943.1 hypothetical protein T551_01887 [Pneumocystis jirovecii RU7]